MRTNEGSSSHRQIEDEVLVLRCREGDAQALEELLARWQERLWKQAWQRINRKRCPVPGVS